MAEKSEPEEDKPPPRCKAILLYERTMVEYRTKKISLIGLIRDLTIEELPGRTSPMKIYLQLVDGIGEFAIRIEVHDLAEDRVIFRARGPRIIFPDRLAALDLSFSIPALPTAHPGRYDVIVFGNGKEIDRQQFRVRLPEDAGEFE